MKKLKGFQKKYLRGLTHGARPVVFIGHKGMTDAVIRSINEALNTHELIKLKFIDFKEKDHKKQIVDRIEKETECENVGIIGHTVIFYRQHADPKKRKIKIASKEFGASVPT